MKVTEAGIHRLADGKLTAAVAIGSADPKETADPIATEAKLAPGGQGDRRRRILARGFSTACRAW